MSKKRNVNCCPMGTNRGNGVVECHWFGLVTLKDCAECDVRKDKNMIRKGD
ncbi:MAG: hypothetical protein J6Y78_10860 [Paludibacteraceae bacterium]|nr:hypothetical protein [Paludibacteraceae bacterium]